LVLGHKTKLFANEVLFFQGDANYTKIHFLSGKPKLIARTLPYIQQKTEDKMFTRISRKHLLNRKFIVEIGADFVVLSDKTILPIVRRRKRELLNSNTFVGYASDATADFSNATAIGADAKVDASNKVRIGDNLVTVIEGQVPFTNPSDRRLKENITINNSWVYLLVGLTNQRMECTRWLIQIL
jgi:hypothetical protein